jgi:hypothetical protein
MKSAVPFSCFFGAAINNDRMRTDP